MNKCDIRELKCLQSSLVCREFQKNIRISKKTKMKIFFIAVILILNLINEIRGHGMVMSPPGRGSRWRTDRTARINYDDNGSNCGGYSNQWMNFNGLCGVCGDPYQDTKPRAHELGGKYGGVGVIVANYTKGSVIQVTVKITANHLGKFLFDICNLDYEGESENCFAKNQLVTVDGKREYEIGSAAKDYFVSLRLPSTLSCNHCVLRWQYICGNNWGWCPEGGGRLGCGPQENFRTCSDIKIFK